MICSHHAAVRGRQRGITPAQIDAVIAYADKEARRGKGWASIWISRRELRRLGPSTPEGVSTDRLHGVTVLQSSDEVYVTVFRNLKSKVYRRNSVEGRL